MKKNKSVKKMIKESQQLVLERAQYSKKYAREIVELCLQKLQEHQVQKIVEALVESSRLPSPPLTEHELRQIQKLFESMPVKPGINVLIKYIETNSFVERPLVSDTVLTLQPSYLTKDPAKAVAILAADENEIKNCLNDCIRANPKFTTRHFSLEMYNITKNPDGTLTYTSLNKCMPIPTDKKSYYGLDSMGRAVGTYPEDSEDSK